MKPNVKVNGKYVQTAEYIVSQIKKGIYRKGGVLPSEEKLAGQLGVSRVTARRAYALLGEKGYVTQRKGSGTYVSKDINSLLYASAETGNAVTAEKKKIALIYPYKIKFFEEFRASIVGNIENLGFRHETFINRSVQYEKELFDSFTLKEYLGAVICPNRIYRDYTYRTFEILERKNIPFVIIGKPPKNIYCNSVYHDDIQASILCVREFYYRGYGGAIHITNNADDLEAVSERREGYELGMKKYFPGKDICVFDTYRPSFNSVVYEYLDKLPSGAKIGVVLYDCLAFNRFLPILAKTKLQIGRNIGVIGFNSPNYYADLIDKNISSMEHDTALLGETALDLLEYSASNVSHTECKHIVLRPNLFIRGVL